MTLAEYLASIKHKRLTSGMCEEILRLAADDD